MQKSGIVLLLLLSGCDGPSLTDKQRDEVEAIASDTAIDQIDDSSRVSDLEARIEDLEAKDAYN